MKPVIKGNMYHLKSLIMKDVFDSLQKASEENAKSKVYLPKLYLFLGLIFSAITLIPGIISLFLNEPILVSIGFFLLSLVGVILIIAYFNCKVIYNDNEFIHKSYWGIRRKFTYDQVTAIKANSHETFIYIGKKRVMIDKFAVGGADFLKFVKKKYRTIHDGQALPKVANARLDIFNGNIKDAGGFIFAYLFISLLFIGVLGVVIYIVYFNVFSESNTEKHTISVVSCEFSSNDILFTSEDNQVYKIRYADELIDEKERTLITDGAEITVYSEKIMPDKKDSYHSVKAIEYMDEYILSFDESNRVYRNENQPAVIILATMCLAWATVVAVSLYVGRNPHKFSTRFVRLFFKDGYVK